MRTPCDHRPLSQPIETRVCSSCAVRFPKGSSPLHFPTRSDVVERSIIEQGRNAFENTIELFLGLCASGRSTRRTLSVAFFFFPFLFFSFFLSLSSFLLPCASTQTRRSISNSSSNRSCSQRLFTACACPFFPIFNFEKSFLQIRSWLASVFYVNGVASDPCLLER